MLKVMIGATWSCTHVRLIREHNDTTDILVSRLWSWGGRKNGNKKLPTSLTCSSGQKFPQILRLQNMQQHKSTQRAFNSISHGLVSARGAAQGLGRKWCHALLKCKGHRMTWHYIQLWPSKTHQGWKTFTSEFKVVCVNELWWEPCWLRDAKQCSVVHLLAYVWICAV